VGDGTSERSTEYLSTLRYRMYYAIDPCHAVRNWFEVALLNVIACTFFQQIAFVGNHLYTPLIVRE